ncbi:hypothetical protein JCM30204_08620 [Dysgonomonas termitidis]
MDKPEAAGTWIYGRNSPNYYHASLDVAPYVREAAGKAYSLLVFKRIVSCIPIALEVSFKGFEQLCHYVPRP